MELTYHVVDVFTTTPLEGNALAVFTDASGLDASTMQRIAREMNLSETTFVLPRESKNGAARVRIFTPGREMDFAGHPTVGTAYVLRRLGLVPRDAATFALEENVGRVPIRVDSGDDPLIWLTTPPIRVLETLSRAACAAAIGLREDDLVPNLPCEIVSAGAPFVFVPIKDAATVDRAALDGARFADLVRGRTDKLALFFFAPVQAGAYARMFAPEHGLIEDPATGGATGPLAAYMMKHRLARSADGTRFLSEQGKKMGRRSLLHVLIHGENGRDGIEVGGNTTYVAEARLFL